VLTGGLTYAALKNGLGSNEVASWLQALGSTIGIAIAIYVPWRQKQDTKLSIEKEQADSALAVTLAIRDELIFAASHFSGANVIELRRDAPGEIFNLVIPIATDRFPIYRAMIGRLTEIREASVRHKVIKAYSGLNGVIEVARLNNDLISEHNKMLRRYYIDGVKALGPELAERQTVLASFRAQMRGILLETIKDVHEAILMLDRIVRGTHDDFGPPPNR